MASRSGIARSGGVAILLRTFVAALALVAACVPAALQADTFDNRQAEQWEFEPVEFTCPVGGEKFRQAVTHPHFALMRFVDGSHMGDNWIEMQIPLCPDNGLVILPDYSSGEGENGLPVYHTYTEAELAALPGLIASEEYRALAADTRQLRGYWLATRLERPLLDRMQLLIHAPWGAADEGQRTRALETYVREAPALVAAYTDDQEKRASASMTIINALRELGRFDEALVLLDAIAAQGLEFESPVGPDAMFSEGPYLPKMRAVILARNTDRNPVALLESSLANRLCNAPDDPSYGPGPNRVADCAARRAALAREQEIREKSYALGRDPAIEEMCATPVAEQEEALQMACHDLTWDRDWEAGGQMFKEDPAAVAVICETTPEDRREGPQKSACSSYDTYRTFAEERLFRNDDNAYRILCEEEPKSGGYGYAFYSGCDRGRAVRFSLEVDRLFEDRAALRRQCRTLPEEREYSPLERACEALEDGDEDPYYLMGGVDDEEPSTAELAATPYVRKQVDEALAARAAE